jgi:predicted membrane chloride channel (bestrophin family)
MVVAMVAVRMMQVTIDQIVDVIAVRHRLVATPWPMQMTGLVPGATMIRCAVVGVPR